MKTDTYYARNRDRVLARLRLQRGTDWSARPCRKCGTTFEPLRRSNQIFCTKACANRWNDRFGSVVQKKVRQMVLRRDDWTCYLCRQPIPSDLPWPHPLSGTVDHVVPWSVSRNDRPENLRAAHWHCNAEKGDRLLGTELGYSMEAA